MAFQKTGRRDDFVSLFYMLIYMLNDGNLWVGSRDPCDGKDDIKKVFESI